MKEEVLDVRKSLLKRLKKGKPRFKRQNINRYPRLKDTWRKPKGRQSKRRRRETGRQKMPSIGYGSPSIIKGLHPSGYEEIRVANLKELESLDAKKQAARLVGTVGAKKREQMVQKASELGIKVLNP
jgi:large subunit ribosomal protein L32e